MYIRYNKKNHVLLFHQRPYILRYMPLEMFPKIPTGSKRKRMVSMRLPEDTVEMLDFLKEHTNAPGREQIVSQLVLHAYAEIQAKDKGKRR